MKGARVLILECYRQTLPVAWALRDAGYRPVLGVRRGSREDRFVGFSRAPDRLWPHSDFEAPGFVGELSGWLTEHGGQSAVLPVGEASLDALMSLRRQQPELASRILIPSDQCIERSLKKDLYPLWAKDLGLEGTLGLPPTRRVQGLTAILDAAAVFGYPLALKPVQSGYRFLGKKCVFVESEEALRALPPEGIEHLELIVQPRARGRRRNLMFFASRGKVGSLFECEVLRTDALDGTGYGVDVKSVEVHPAHREAVEAIVSGFSWDGLGCAQFMFDAGKGKSQFLEINPRIDANFALAQLSGVNLVAHAVTDRLSDSPPPLEPRPYRVGRRLHWTLGDLDGLREPGLSRSQRTGRVKDVFRTLVGAHGHAVFRWKDPLPELYLGYRWAGSLAKVTIKNLLSRRQSGR